LFHPVILIFSPNISLSLFLSPSPPSLPCLN
jgi:hypothetical protein